MLLTNFPRTMGAFMPQKWARIKLIREIQPGYRSGKSALVFRPTFTKPPHLFESHPLWFRNAQGAIWRRIPGIVVAGDTLY
jgi:hypothetical protein